MPESSGSLRTGYEPRRDASLEARDPGCYLPYGQVVSDDISNKSGAPRSHMLGTFRRSVARFLYHLIAGSPITSVVEPDTPAQPPGPQEPDGAPAKRLLYVTQAYQEVLDATKHQDDKIGRFMAGIAFLIAGALVFTNPVVLQASYRLDNASLPLPGLALGTFIVLIVLSLLFYLLAMSAPLTIPSPTRSPVRKSHLFFLLIAGETRETWHERWHGASSAEGLERDLLDEYINETRNIALRADQKYERSVEASALFVLALLFFLIGLVLSIHVIQHLQIAPNANQATAPVDLAWSLPLRGVVGGLLAFFSVALIYQRLRAAQTQGLDTLVRDANERLSRGPRELTGIRRRWAQRKWNALHALLVAYPVFILLTLLPDRGLTVTNVIVCQFLALAALGAGFSYLRILSRPSELTETSPGEYAGNRAIAWSTAAIVWVFGGYASFAVLCSRSIEQLCIALVAATSPLAANLFDSSFKLNRRLRRHLS